MASLAGLLAFGLSAGAAPGSKQVGDLLEPIRQKYKLPALAGAILTGRGLVAIGAVGVRKAGTQIPVTTADEWHLGSDTKAMTATLIASLVEQRRLAWDATLEQVFPGLAGSMNPEMRRVTLLQLLSHRAGLPHDIDWRQVSGTGTLREQREAVVKIVGSMRPRLQPGAKYEYSNVGYVLAGAMAERVANQSWETLISSTLFAPLDMKTAGFGGLGTPGQIDQPWPHHANGKPVARNGPPADNPEVMGPAGTVHSSLSDWARFVARRGAPLGRGDRAHPAGSNTMNFAVVWMAPKRDFAVLACTNQGGDGAARAADEAAAALIRDHRSRPG